MSSEILWNIEKIKNFLPDDLTKLLDFEDFADVVTVKTKHFLGGGEGKKTWNLINKLLKQCGGDWISLGKDSHWKILKVQKDLDVYSRIEKALEHIHEAAKILEVGPE